MWYYLLTDVQEAYYQRKRIQQLKRGKHDRWKIAMHWETGYEIQINLVNFIESGYRVLTRENSNLRWVRVTFYTIPASVQLSSRTVVSDVLMSVLHSVERTPDRVFRLQSKMNTSKE